MPGGHACVGGAVCIHILDHTGAGLVLRVEGRGDFPFRAVGC